MISERTTVNTGRRRACEEQWRGSWSIHVFNKIPAILVEQKCFPQGTKWILICFLAFLPWRRCFSGASLSSISMPYIPHDWYVSTTQIIILISRRINMMLNNCRLDRCDIFCKLSSMSPITQNVEFWITFSMNAIGSNWPFEAKFQSKTPVPIWWSRLN